MAIQIIDGFDVFKDQPIDSRYVVTDKTTISSTYRYEGLIVYDTVDDNLWILKGGILDANWLKVGSILGAGTAGRIAVWSDTETLTHYSGLAWTSASNLLAVTGRQTITWNDIGSALAVSNTAIGGTKYAVNAAVTGTGTANYAGYFSASGGTLNYGVYSNAGDNYFSGLVLIGTTTQAGTCKIEVRGSAITSGVLPYIARFSTSTTEWFNIGINNGGHSHLSSNKGIVLIPGEDGTVSNSFIIIGSNSTNQRVSIGSASSMSSKFTIIGNGNTNSYFRVQDTAATPVMQFDIADSGFVSIGSTLGTLARLTVTHTATVNDHSGIAVNVSGTVNTKQGLYATVTGGSTTNIGVRGEASGATNNYGGYFRAITSGTGSNVAIYLRASDGGTNYAIMSESGNNWFKGVSGFGSSTAPDTNQLVSINSTSRTYALKVTQSYTVANAYGVDIELTSVTSTAAHGLRSTVASSGGINYAGYFSATAGTTNYAIYTAAGHLSLARTTTDMVMIGAGDGVGKLTILQSGNANTSGIVITASATPTVARLSMYASSDTSAYYEANTGAMYVKNTRGTGTLFLETAKQMKFTSTDVTSQLFENGITGITAGASTHWHFEAGQASVAASGTGYGMLIKPNFRSILGTATIIYHSIEPTFSVTGLANDVSIRGYNVVMNSSSATTGFNKRGINVYITGTAVSNTGVYLSVSGATTNHAIHVAVGTSYFVDNISVGVIPSALYKISTESAVTGSTVIGGTSNQGNQNNVFRYSSTGGVVGRVGNIYNTFTMESTGSAKIEDAHLINNQMNYVSSNATPVDDFILIRNIVTTAGTGAIQRLYASYYTSLGTGSVVNEYGYYVGAMVGTNQYAFYAINTASVTAAKYGYYVNVGGGTSNYAIYSAAGTNYFASALEVGTLANPTVYGENALYPGGIGGASRTFSIRTSDDFYIADRNNTAASAIIALSTTLIEFFNGRLTTSGNQSYKVKFSGSKTAITGVGRYMEITPTLVASANSDVLSAIYLAPTYTVGAFTGLNAYGININHTGAAANNYGYNASVTGAGNNYGLYLTVSGGTNNYAIYSSNGVNVFAARSFFGTTDITLGSNAPTMVIRNVTNDLIQMFDNTTRVVQISVGGRSVWNGSLVASGGAARYMYIVPTALVATANNDEITYLAVTGNTTTKGAFTGVKSYGIKIDGDTSIQTMDYGVFSKIRITASAIDGAAAGYFESSGSTVATGNMYGIYVKSSRTGGISPGTVIITGAKIESLTGASNGSTGVNTLFGTDIVFGTESLATIGATLAVGSRIGLSHLTANAFTYTKTVGVQIGNLTGGTQAAGTVWSIESTDVNAKMVHKGAAFFGNGTSTLTDANITAFFAATIAGLYVGNGPGGGDGKIIVFGDASSTANSNIEFRAQYNSTTFCTVGQISNDLYVKSAVVGTDVIIQASGATTTSNGVFLTNGSGLSGSSARYFGFLGDASLKYVGAANTTSWTMNGTAQTYLGYSVFGGTTQTNNAQLNVIYNYNSIGGASVRYGADNRQTFALTTSANQTGEVGGTYNHLNINSSVVGPGAFTSVKATHNEINLSAANTSAITTLYLQNDKLVGNASASTVTTGYGYKLESNSVTVTTMYGIHLDLQGTFTNLWGIYQTNASAKNHFNGSILVGTTSLIASEKLHVAGGVEISGTASYLRFPNLTTIQKGNLTATTGMVVYDTDLAKLQVYSGGAWVDLH